MFAVPMRAAPLIVTSWVLCAGCLQSVPDPTTTLPDAGRPPCFPANGNAATPVLTFGRGAEVIDVHADGSKVSAHTFFSATSASTSLVDSLQTESGFVLASASQGAAREAVLLDATGATRWVRTPTANDVYQLGADGWTWVTGMAPAFAIDPTGASHPLGGAPVASFGPGGWVPTQQASGALQLERPADQATLPIAALPTHAPGLRWLDDRLVFLSGTTSFTSLRVSAPELTFDLGASFTDAKVLAATGNWVVVESSDGSRISRIDLDAQTATPIAAVYPDGWGPIEAVAGVETISVDANGTLIRGLAHPTGSALFQSGDLGHSWTPVGAEVPTATGQRVMWSQHQGSSWLVAAEDLNGAVTTLASASMVSGAGVAVLEAGAIGFGAPLRTPTLDAAGTCAAFWKPDADEAAQAKNAELRIRGADGSQLSLGSESVPLTEWTPALWR